MGNRVKGFFEVQIYYITKIFVFNGSDNNGERGQQLRQKGVVWQKAKLVGRKERVDEVGDLVIND